MSEEEKEWYIKGDWVEACGSPPICPGYFLSPFPRGCCEGVMTFNIIEGKYGNVDLGGLKTSFGFNTPEGMSISKGITIGMGKWKSILYIDKNASAEQADALEKMLTKFWKGFGEVIKTKRAEINFTKKLVRKGPAAKFTIEIPDIFLLKTIPLTGLTGKPTKVVDSPLVSGVIYVASAKINEFKDSELPRTWKHENMSATYFEMELYSKEMLPRSTSE